MGFRIEAASAVQFVMVPALLVIGFLVAGVSAGQVYPKARAAAYGGFWSGTLATAVVVLALRDVDLWEPGPLPWWVAPAGVLMGTGLGCTTTLFYIWFRDRPFVALPLFLQAGGSLCLLYLFLVWPGAQGPVGWVALGIAPSAFLFYTLFRDRPPLSRSDAVLPPVPRPDLGPAGERTPEPPPRQPGLPTPSPPSS